MFSDYIKQLGLDCSSFKTFKYSNLSDFLPAFMLVTPDDEVKESFNEMFRNVIAWAVLGTVLQNKKKYKKKYLSYFNQ